MMQMGARDGELAVSNFEFLVITHTLEQMYGYLSSV